MPLVLLMVVLKNNLIDNYSMQTMSREAGEMFRRGYVTVDIPMLSSNDRLHAAKAGVEIIMQAMIDEVFAGIVSTTLAPNLDVPTNPTVFGVSGPRNTNDSKIYWHCGYQVLSKIEDASPRNVPAEIKNEVQFLRSVLDQCSEAWVSTAERLGIPKSTLQQIVPAESSLRNIHLRTVRYVGSASLELWDKVFGEHADLGVGTLRLWENAPNTLRAVAIPPDMFYDGIDEERVKAINSMYTNAQPMHDLYDNEAHFFWGGGINGLNSRLRGDNFPRSYPILYHGGDAYAGTITPHEGMDIANGDGVALLACVSPAVEMLTQNTLFDTDRPYAIPTVQMCRPGK